MLKCMVVLCCVMLCSKLLSNQHNITSYEVMVIHVHEYVIFIFIFIFLLHFNEDGVLRHELVIFYKKQT